jgi:hypothetical protein
MNTYSPWQEASSSVQGLGNALNNVALGMARLRYNQAMQEQQMRQEMQEMAIRQAVANAQIQRDQAAASYDQARVQSADRMRDARARMIPPTSGAPTVQNAEIDNFAQLVSEAVRSAALSGDASQLLTPHNIPANNAAVTPLTGERNVGPVVLNPNETYEDMGQRIAGMMLLNQGQTAFQGGQPVARGGVALSPRSQYVPPVGGAGAGQPATNEMFSSAGVANNTDVGELQSAAGVLRDIMMSAPTAVQKRMAGDDTAQLNRRAVMAAQAAKILPLVMNQISNAVSGATAPPTDGGKLPPPAQRKPGDRVRTAKGLFEWTGTGWKPVAQ